MLVLAGFWLPWVEGSGPLAGVSFSGYELVGYAGHLQGLEQTTDGTTMLLVRIGTVATAVAGTWLVVLGIAGRWRPLAVACGAWVLATALALVWANIAGGQLLAGTIVTSMAAVLVVACEGGLQVRRWRRAWIPRWRELPGPAAPAVESAR